MRVGNAPGQIEESQSKMSNTLTFRLYVTSGDPNSQRALANLRTICSEYFGRDYHLEVIDLSNDPVGAKRDAIAQTPTLIKLSPEPTWVITGDLSDETMTLLAMTTPQRE